MKTINKLVNPQHLTLFEIGKNTIIILMILISVSTASAQRFERYKDSVSVVKLSNEEHLFINHTKGDTLLVKKGTPLSEKEMRADLKYFEETIGKIDPTIPIKTALTGFPIMEKIRENNQACTDKRMDCALFGSTLMQGINYCMSYGILNKPKESHPHYFNDYPYSLPEYAEKQHYLYIDGSYYLHKPFPQKKIGNSLHYISEPCTLRIESKDGIPIGQYVTDNFAKHPKMQWDYFNKQFYSEYDKYQFFWEVRMEPEAGKRKGKTYHSSSEYLYGFACIDSDHPVVWYNEEQKLIYLRIPGNPNYFSWTVGYKPADDLDAMRKRMNMEIMDSITKKLQQFKGKEIDKLVIDLRFDKQMPVRDLIKNALSSIIQEPLYLNRDLYILNTPEAIDLVTKTFSDPIDGNNTKEVCGTSYLFCSSETDTILPASESLNYSGDIYFFVDGNLSKYDFCFLNDLQIYQQFRVWGVPTGHFLDNGHRFFIDKRDSDVTLELPNSGLTIILNPFITFPPKLENFYDAGIEKRIFMTKEQDVLFRTTKGYIFTYDFLKENDPYFRELLEVGSYKL